jgi:multidrug efflux pump subunit AcrA (membrane-fusion protein)
VSVSTDSKPQPPKVIRVVVVPALVLLGGFAAFAGLSKLRAARPAPTVQERTPTRVQVAPLAPRSITMDVTGHGTARARDRVHLSAEVTGRVAFVATSVRSGSFVAKDEVLVRLDDRQSKINLRRAGAEVARLEAELKRLETSQPHLLRERDLRAERAKLAHSEWQRLRFLEPKGAATPSQVELAQGAWIDLDALSQAAKRSVDQLPHTIAQAKAALAAGEAALDQARFDHERLVLRAPLAAQVNGRNVEVGQIVAPGAPLVALSGHEVYEVAVQLSHDDLTKLALIPAAALPRGLKAPPGFSGTSRAEVQWVGQEGARWPARLTRIESVDTETRTIPAIVEVEQPWRSLERGKKPLLPGAYCRVTFRGQPRAKAWVVPEHSLREGDRLYLLRAGKLAITSVRVEHLFGNEAVVIPAAPFESGDELVVSSITFPVVGMTLVKEGGKGQ